MNFGIDDQGLQYAQMISDNVVEKLKITLGIPTDELHHEKLQQFFVEKFTPPEVAEFEHYIKDAPELELVSREMFGYDTMSPEN